MAQLGFFPTSCAATGTRSYKNIFSVNYATLKFQPIRDTEKRSRDDLDVTDWLKFQRSLNYAENNVYRIGSGNPTHVSSVATLLRDLNQGRFINWATAGKNADGRLFFYLHHLETLSVSTTTKLWRRWDTPTAPRTSRTSRGSTRTRRTRCCESSRRRSPDWKRSCQTGFASRS